MAFKSAAADTIGGQLPNRMLRDLTRRRISDTAPPLVSRPCPGCFQRSPGRQSPTLKGIEYPSLIVRSILSRWGSLSRAGIMTLNVNLVRGPAPLLCTW